MIFLIKKIDSLKEKFISLGLTHLHGNLYPKIGKKEVLGLCLVRNGEEYIEEFLEHHFRIGIKHFIFLDNGSEDKTVDLIKKIGKERVTILQTDFPFKNNGGMIMRQFLLENFGKEKWTLTLDIDEFFDYPFSSSLGLDEFIDYLNEKHYNAVVTQLLDMFPLELRKDEPGLFDRKKHIFYTIESIQKINYFFNQNGYILCPNGINGCIKIFLGGVRKQLFDCVPVLTKHALVFNDEQLKKDRLGHLLVEGRVADISCVLFHYKFNAKFFDRVREAIKKEHYYNKSKEYKKYYEYIKNRNEISFRFIKGRKILKRTNQLIKDKFLVVSLDYLKKIKNKNAI